MHAELSLPVIYDVASLVKNCTLAQCLTRLGGPAVLVFPGKTRDRCRVLVTLLHGNEPSGLAAVMAVAQQNVMPQVTCYVIVASVAAAVTPPLFSHRMLPGQPDLNRCFSLNGQGETTALAKAIIKTIHSLRPECVIDLHNTSGSGPDFAVSPKDSGQHRALAACFTSQLIVTDIRLGALMEQPLGGPVITVEAGGAQDPRAARVATAGVQRFFTQHDIFIPHQRVRVLKHPRRLELKTGWGIAYTPGPDTATDVCMRADIEKYNTGVTPAGTVLGWLPGNALTPLKLDRAGANLSAYFRVINGALTTTVPLHIFMATTRPDIARTDCLFYFIATDTEM